MALRSVKLGLGYGNMVFNGSLEKGGKPDWNGLSLKM